MSDVTHSNIYLTVSMDNDIKVTHTIHWSIKLYTSNYNYKLGLSRATLELELGLAWG